MSGAGPKSSSNYVDFMHGDIFQGFGFMVDPEAGYKSVTDFIDEGMEPTASIKATAEQFRGKALATLNEGGIRGFITIALESAGMSMDDITVNSFDTDSKIVAEMISGRADFAVGSAPSRVSMTLEGFVPVMTSLHISQFAAATPDSKELRAVFHDGWATTRDYYANNKETLYRFASMIYRTLRLMVDRPQETIPTHTDFLNSIMGSTLMPVDVEVIYDELNPFVPFEDQAMWYEDRYRSTNPEHYANITAPTSSCGRSRRSSKKASGRPTTPPTPSSSGTRCRRSRSTRLRRFARPGPRFPTRRPRPPSCSRRPSSMTRFTTSTMPGASPARPSSGPHTSPGPRPRV